MPVLQHLVKLSLKVHPALLLLARQLVVRVPKVGGENAAVTLQDFIRHRPSASMPPGKVRDSFANELPQPPVNSFDAPTGFVAVHLLFFEQLLAELLVILAEKTGELRARVDYRRAAYRQTVIGFQQEPYFVDAHAEHAQAR